MTIQRRCLGIVRSSALTAKANGVEPHAYLSFLFAQLPYAKTVEDFETLLPWNVKASLAQSLERAR
ncbi:MAG: transposase [Gammaproteobacteria bacterium]|nr:transposase [Gammaproteobacteria bacterium]